VSDSLVTRRFQSQLAKPFLEVWLKRSPTDLLLGLEWMLLIGVTLTNILLPLPGQPQAIVPLWSTVPLWQLLTIVAFGMMGLRRPKQNLGFKTLYTVTEFGLVYLPLFLDPRISYTFPPLHLIIVVRSCSMFGKLGQLIIAICAGVSFTISLFAQNLNIITPSNAVVSVEQFSSMMLTMRLNASFAFMLISTFILLLTNTLLFVQRSRQELAHAHEQLRQYALQIEDQATLQERNRIARELHDALGHALIAQSLQLDTVHCFWQAEPDKAFRALREAKQLGSQALNDVRHAVSTLRIDPLQGLSLDSAIAKLIQSFHQTTGILPSCTLRLAVAPPKNVTLCVYRVIQEALTNIAKHSQPTEVSIYIQTTSEQLNVLIQDNGIGFDPSQNRSGFGLQGMQERTLALGGLFSIVSQPGLGCKIMTQIPLADLQSTSS
jgi:signal transduction histidine kinase